MARREKKEAARLRVLVHLGMRFKSGRQIAMGALRYAASHKRLELHVTDGKDPRYDFLNLGDWRPDGLIADPWGVKEGAPHVKAKVLFHVSEEEASREPPGSCVLMAFDNKAAGRMAARIFKRHNLRHFGFVGNLHDFQWSRERREAFFAALAAEGMEPPLDFRSSPGASLSQDRNALSEWLLTLPKPCAVFAANDLRAMGVLDACRLAGIAVPEAVQVLGVDNEEYICEQTQPTLSSIEVDYEGAGYEAMRILDAKLGGEPFEMQSSEPRPAHADAARSPVVTYGMLGVIERLSTRDCKGTARIVNLALDFIRRHGESRATASDVAKAAGCSLRLLERNFRETLGSTVVQELQRVRLEKACRILRHTETPIGEIGQLCGYEDEVHFRKLFRRAYGVSMSQLRAQISAGRVATAGGACCPSP